MKFFLFKNIPLIKLFNDFITYSEFNIKKEGNIFKYQKLTDNFSFNFIFIY
jgi:hypothetical protein